MKEKKCLGFFEEDALKMAKEIVKLNYSPRYFPAVPLAEHERVVGGCEEEVRHWKGVVEQKNRSLKGCVSLAKLKKAIDEQRQMNAYDDIVAENVRVTLDNIKKCLGLMNPRERGKK